MVSEAFDMRPMKRPTCTNTSVTAKATPETVMKKRSLSWSSDFVARSTAMALLLRERAGDHVDDGARAVGDRPPLDPVVVALGDLERDHAVDGRPDGLRDEVDVRQILAKAAAGDQLGDDAFQKRVGIFLGVAL